ncbi:MAG TPA: ABC transporter substrate-binding protein, partial [Allocoleopsis sp.]
MNNNKETQILIISLIATLGIVGLGIGIFRDKMFPGQNSTQTGQNSTPATNKSTDDNAQIIFTTGEKELIKTTEAKTKGITAFASGNYDEAKNQFEISLKQQKNDPEALIYLNNSRIGKNDSYTIAIIAPVSSKPNEAPEILRGIAQGQNNINNSPQKINGKYLKVLIVDEGNNAKKAEQAANLLIEKKEVLGVVGHWSSGVTLAAGQVYQSNKLVAISPTSTSVKLSGFGNFIFRTTPSDQFAGTALANHSIKKLNKRKAVIFYDSTSDYSKSLKSVFTTGLYGDGGEVITEFDLHDTNFNAFNSLQKAKQKGAEIIMLIPSSDQPILDKALKVAKANEEQLPILA